MTEDPTLTAAALAVAFGLVKILEAVVTYGIKKLMGADKKQEQDRPLLVEIAPETRDLIAQTYRLAVENHEDIRDIVPELRRTETALGTKIDNVYYLTHDLKHDK